VVNPFGDGVRGALGLTNGVKDTHLLPKEIRVREVNTHGA